MLRLYELAFWLRWGKQEARLWISFPRWSLFACSVIFPGTPANSSGKLPQIWITVLDPSLQNKVNQGPASTHQIFLAPPSRWPIVDRACASEFRLGHVVCLKASLGVSSRFLGQQILCGQRPAAILGSALANVRRWTSGAMWTLLLLLPALLMAQ